MVKTLTTSFRLSIQARQLLAESAAHLGISQTAVVELAIRHFAKKGNDYERKGMDTDEGSLRTD